MCSCLLQNSGKEKCWKAAFSSICAVLFWKQINEQIKCWTSETPSIIRLFLSFPGVPTAPVGTVPPNHLNGHWIRGRWWNVDFNSPSTLRLDLPLPCACPNYWPPGAGNHLPGWGTPILARLLLFEIAEMAFLVKKRGDCLDLALNTSNQLPGLMLGLRKSLDHTCSLPHWRSPTTTRNRWWGSEMFYPLSLLSGRGAGLDFLPLPFMLAQLWLWKFSLAVLPHSTPSLELLWLSGRLIRFVGLCYLCRYLSAWAGSTAGYTLRGFQN